MVDGKIYFYHNYELEYLKTAADLYYHNKAIKMKTNGIFSLLMITLIPLIKGTESGDYYNHLELEKALIRNKEPPKANPGQIIAAVSSISSIIAPTTTQNRPTLDKSTPASEEIKPKPTQTTSPVNDKNKPKKDKPDGSSSGGGKDGKEKKKPSSSQDQDDDDDINKLPKRLFRPRFRAESSADSVSTSSTLFTLAISFIMILFI